MTFIETHRKEDFTEEESIFALAPFPMWIFDLETLRFLAVNDEAVRQYGYSEREFLSMKIDQIRPVEDIPLFEKVIEKLRKRPEVFEESLFRHQKKDRSIITVQIKSNLIRYKGRKAELVTAIDLTERLREQKRIEKQTRYLETIEKINDRLLKAGDWLPALDQCFEIVGETLEIDRIYFFQNDLKEETISQRLEWVRVNIDSQIDNPKLQSIPLSEFPILTDPLKIGKNFEAVVADLPPSPTRKFLQEQDIKSILVAPVMSHDSFIGFLGMDDCTTERKWTVEETQIIKSLATNLAHVITRHNIQTELVNNEYKFRTIVQRGSDLIAILDEEGFFRYANLSSIEVLGIPPDDFIGRHIRHYIHPEDISRVEKGVQEVLNTDVVSIPPFRFPDATGSYRWLETKLTNLLDDPVISGIVANSWDVTFKMERQMENELVVTLSKAIGSPASLKQCLGDALKIFLNLPAIGMAEAWVKSQDGSRLDLRGFTHDNPLLASFHSKHTTETSFSQGNNFPGVIWKNRKMLVWENLAAHPDFVRRAAAKETGLQTGIGIPITYNNEFLGCFILYSRKNRDTFTDLEKLLKEVGEKLGAVVKQKLVEEEYRIFFEITPDPHCILGFDGRLKKFNQAFCKLLEYDEAALVNKEIIDLIHEEDRDKAFQSKESAISKETTGSSTLVRFKTKTGQVKWLIWGGTTIPEAKIFIAGGKDITEQKSAEQELEKTNARLKKAQKIANLGYWTHEVDNELSEWSEETYKIFGYTPENFVPTMENVINAFHPEDQYLIKRDPTKNLIPGEIRSFEHRIITASGEERWIHQEIYMEADKGGNPIRMQGTVQDITERKENEEQLKISNERFRLAMKASNEMIWEIDHIKNVISRGGGHEEVIDYNLTESYNINNSWCSKIYPEDFKRAWDSFQDALADPKKNYWKEEYRIFSENGTVLYFIDRCYIYRDEKGKPVRSIGSVLDVTVSRRQLEQIKLQNENLREIAWLQSHVVRAPLAKIMGLVGLAKDYGGGGMSFEQIFEMISTSAEELDQVIREIAQKTEMIEENEKNFADR